MRTKRKHGQTNTRPSPTAKKTSRLAKITAPDELDKEAEEVVEAATTDTVIDLSEANEFSVPIWHRYIDTSRSAPRHNPVQHENNHLRTSFSNMMSFIEGAARSCRLKALTQSQKESLARDSEACEMALKSVLDSYLKKLEAANIIPHIIDDSGSSTPVSDGTGDMDSDADPVGLANIAVPTSYCTQTGMTEASDLRVKAKCTHQFPYLIRQDYPQSLWPFNPVASRPMQTRSKPQTHLPSHPQQIHSWAPQSRAVARAKV